MELFEQVFSVGPDGIPVYRALIGGEWREADNSHFFEVLNPADGSLIARVSACSVKDTNDAIRSARQALSGLPALQPVKRLEIMSKAREILLEHVPEMASTITRESGKPISLASSEVKAAAERLRVTMEEARVLHGEFIPSGWVEDTEARFGLVMRHPIGVVASISSFNYPLYIPAAKIIPALLAGNAVVAKPASDTPLSLLLFGRILQQAGIPDGSLNIVPGSGAEVGDTLASSPLVDAVSFTGSTAIGERIASLAGMKKRHLELGGKAAALVFPDAILPVAAREICKGSFRNSGQRCDAISRVLVHREVKPALLQLLLKEAGNYPLGDPMDPSTALGPLINRKALENVHRLVSDALEKGARPLLGAKYEGLFYHPTILDGVTTDMDIAWMETFGPVIPVIEVENMDQAVHLANRSEFGLDSCLFTQDLNHALKVAMRLEDGSVTINAAPAHGIGAFPFGGNKKSGIGREGLKYSIDELTRLHTVIFSTS